MVSLTPDSIRSFLGSFPEDGYIDNTPGLNYMDIYSQIKNQHLKRKEISEVVGSILENGNLPSRLVGRKPSELIHSTNAQHK